MTICWETKRAFHFSLSPVSNNSHLGLCWCVCACAFVRVCAVPAVNGLRTQTKKVVFRATLVLRNEQKKRVLRSHTTPACQLMNLLIALSLHPTPINRGDESKTEWMCVLCACVVVVVAIVDIFVFESVHFVFPFVHLHTLLLIRPLLAQSYYSTRKRKMHQIRRVYLCRFHSGCNVPQFSMG